MIPIVITAPTFATTAPSFVITGLDPVIHADFQQALACVVLPHGPPDQYPDQVGAHGPVMTRRGAADSGIQKAVTVI